MKPTYHGCLRPPLPRSRSGAAWANQLAFIAVGPCPSHGVERREDGMVLEVLEDDATVAGSSLVVQQVRHVEDAEALSLSAHREGLLRTL